MISVLIAIAIATALLAAATFIIHRMFRPLRSLRHRDPFAGPAETADPDGALWLTQLLQDRPALSYRRPGGTPVCVLPLPHETGPLPWAVGHWGMSAHDKADELARTYYAKDTR